MKCFSLFCGVALAVLSFNATTMADVVLDTRPANNQANLTAAAGQTFTTGTLTNKILSTIFLSGPQTDPGGTSPLTFAISISVDTDGNFATWDPGASLGQSAVQTLTAGAAGTVDATFNFTSLGINLLNNTVYALRFTDGAGTSVNARMGLTNANGTATGALFSNGVEPFSGAFDASMQINTTAAVPEPTSLALLGLGAIGLVSRRRR